MNLRNDIQKNAIKQALSNNYATISIPVRVGKTFIGLSIASQFNKVLVSYPNQSIFNSWIQDSKKFNISVDNIIFTTHVSLNKYDLKSFNCILIDEIHDLSINQWKFIEGNMPIRMYGLTATPPNKGEKKVFLDKYCPISYERSLDETTGILQKDYTITVHLLEPSSEKNIPLKSGKFWSEKAKIGFWEGKYTMSRNFQDMLRLIQSIQNSKTKLDYVKELSSKLDRCLIFLETQKQCEELGYSTYHSNHGLSEENLKLFQEGTVSHLTCVKQLSAGIQFNSLSKAIILHAYASNSRFHQRLGRVLSLVNNDEIQAEVHLICLKGTRDEQWVKQALSEFNSNKIIWKTV